MSISHSRSTAHIFSSNNHSCSSLVSNTLALAPDSTTSSSSSLPSHISQMEEGPYGYSMGSQGLSRTSDRSGEPMMGMAYLPYSTCSNSTIERPAQQSHVIQQVQEMLLLAFFFCCSHCFDAILHDSIYCKSSDHIAFVFVLPLLWTLQHGKGVFSVPSSSSSVHFSAARAEERPE